MEDIKLQNLYEFLIEKKKIRYSFKTNHDEIIHSLHAIIHRILTELDLSFLVETIHVILIELISNFLKAIAKRVYFLENNLDIFNYKDYVENIPGFKEKVLEQWDRFVFSLKDYNFYLFFDLLITKESLIFYLENNVKVNIFEKERISKRLSPEQDSLHYGMDPDLTEGGGLGLYLIRTLLENSGIGRKNFRMECKANSTRAILRIPIKLHKPGITKYLKNLILHRIDTLPTFPEHLQELIEKCDSGDVDTDYIITKIMHDPALTSQILKLASSAGYITRNKNPDLKLSINLLGLKQLKHLLMIYAARNVFSKLVHKQILEQIWYESNRIAFFAQKLQTDPDLKETNFIIGILNLVGKLVIYSLDTDEIRTIKTLSQNRGNTIDILEELELGISYPEIGAILAELWKFPSDVIYGIRYQLKPIHISEDKIPLVYPVYMAKCMNEILKKKISYDFIEYRVLRYYNFLNRREAFLDLCREFDEEFKTVITGI